MSKGIRRRHARRPSSRIQSGFTLVEMPVVLLVIGLSIGAVSIGKDMPRNAGYTKIKQKYGAGGTATGPSATTALNSLHA